MGAENEHHERRLVCQTVHAERLHEDRVWRAVSTALAHSERAGARWTFFVYPLRARLARVDLRDRLSELAGRGHEIAQHTHYYEPPANGELQKRTLLSDDNIGRALDEDYEYLLNAGFRPQGFVSGGWAVHDAIFAWLGARAFSYDCTYRNYTLAYEHDDAIAGDACQQPFRLRQGGLIEIPTTASVSDGVVHKALGRSRSVSVGGLRYDMYYLHDYDLLRFRTRAALAGLDRLVARTKTVTASELAGKISHELTTRLG